MSKVCDATGKSRNNGNNVSHANNKTKRVQQVNLQSKKLFDPETGKTYNLKLSTRAIKTLNRVGSVADFLKKFPHLAK
jgi:large subunit ribosomal protein L28